MKKITELSTVRLSPVVKVTFPNGSEYLFSSLKAMYEVFTVEEIGKPLWNLWTKQIEVGYTYDTGKCTITKVNIVRLKQKNR